MYPKKHTASYVFTNTPQVIYLIDVGLVGIWHAILNECWYNRICLEIDVKAILVIYVWHFLPLTQKIIQGEKLEIEWICFSDVVLINI